MRTIGSRRRRWKLEVDIRQFGFVIRTPLLPRSRRELGGESGDAVIESFFKRTGQDEGERAGRRGRPAQIVRRQGRLDHSGLSANGGFLVHRSFRGAQMRQGSETGVSSAGQPATGSTRNWRCCPAPGHCRAASGRRADPPRRSRQPMLLPRLPRGAEEARRPDLDVGRGNCFDGEIIRAA